MRLFGYGTLLLLLSVSFASAGTLPANYLSSTTKPFSRGLYQCDDGSPDFAWYADMAGEGFANQFSVMGGGIARIDTIYLTVDGGGLPEQTILLGVWNDADGSPGNPIYLEPLDLTPYVPEPGYFVWVAVPLTSANVVVENDFWIGYFDDLSLTYRPHLDDSGGCNTWFYDPIVSQWIDIDDHPLGLPPGLSLLFRCWAFESVAVELVSFEASAEDDNVLLEWSTATETNTFGFYVTRSNLEEGGYVRISNVISGAGTTSIPQTYSYLDSCVTIGVRYFYRLIDVDTAGNETAHGPVTIRLLPDQSSSWGGIKAEFE